MQNLMYSRYISDVYSAGCPAPTITNMSPTFSGSTVTGTTFMAVGSTMTLVCNAGFQLSPVAPIVSLCLATGLYDYLSISPAPSCISKLTTVQYI